MSIYKISNEFEKSVNFFPDKKRIAFLKNNLYNDYEDSPAVEIQYNSGAKKVIHYKDNKIPILLSHSLMACEAFKVFFALYGRDMYCLHIVFEIFSL